MNNQTNQIIECGLSALLHAWHIIINDETLELPDIIPCHQLRNSGHRKWYLHINFIIDEELRFAGGCMVQIEHQSQLLHIRPTRVTIAFPGHERTMELPAWLTRENAQQMHVFTITVAHGDDLVWIKTDPPYAPAS